MGRNSKSLVIISGLKCNVRYEGHTIYFLNYLKKVQLLFDKTTILITEGDGRVIKNSKKIIVIDELKENKLGLCNKYNITIIKKFNVKENILHFFYAPKVLFLPIFFPYKSTFYTFPDSWHRYYNSKMISSKKIKFLANSIFYKFLEILINKICIKSIYVSQSEGKFHNSVIIPPFTNNYKNYNNKTGILIGRTNPKLLDELLSKLIKIKFENNISVISKDEYILKKYKDFININFYGWIENYEDFSSRHLIHLIYDKWASGFSTKLINALNTKSLAVGSATVFRGLPTQILKNLRLKSYYASDLDNLVVKVKEISKLDSKSVNSLILHQQKNIMPYLDKSNNSDLILDFYFK